MASGQPLKIVQRLMAHPVCTIDFCPYQPGGNPGVGIQPGRNQMYQSLEVTAKRILERLGTQTSSSFVKI